MEGGDEGGGMVCEVGVFLPNRDLISEPKHTVCEDATRHGAAPVLPVGRLALYACREGGAVYQSAAHERRGETRVQRKAKEKQK